MSQIIFYGAGEWAQDNLERLVNEGIEPLCFADKDKKKHHTFITSTMEKKYEILPLTLIIERYPDYTLYLTIDEKNHKKVVSYLKEQGIPDNRLNFLGRQKRIGCKQLGKTFVVDGDFFRICCPTTPKNLKFFSFPHDNLNNGLKNYNSSVDYLINCHEKGDLGPCEGCSNLMVGFYECKKNTKMDTILFCNYNWSENICNLKCIYCRQYCHHERSHERPVLKDIVVQAAELFNNSNNDIIFGFAIGEFFARKDADEILNYLSKQRYKIRVTTNATIYKESFMQMLEQGKVYRINTSLDSGTKETYEKIKKRDLFDNAVENLSRFSGKCKQLHLKYVIIPRINDNEKDFEGFLNIACRIKARIFISADYYELKNRIPKDTLNSVILLYNKAKELRLSPILLKEHFNFEDRLLLEHELKL